MKTERILLIASALFVTLRFLSAFDTSDLVMIPLSLLAIVYWPGGFYFLSGQSIKHQRVALSILGGLALSMIVFGFIFQILFLSGAREMLIMGLPMTLILLTITIFLSGKQEIQMSPPVRETLIEPQLQAIENPSPTKPDLSGYYSRMIFRLAIGLIVGTGTFFIDQESLIRFTYRKDPQLAELFVLSHRSTTDEEYSKYQKMIRDYKAKQDSQP